MVAALQLPRSRPPRRATPQPRAKQGVWQDQIPGRFHPITVHQLAMAWWLYKEGPLTKRQLRVYFAAHEMKERRRYTKSEDGTRTVGEGGRRPLYTLDEVRSLIGSRDNDTALSADVKALGRLGLVKIRAHAIEFAVSIDQIAVDDISGFWAFFDRLPNRRRTVPVPRRTVRALAAGFQSSVTGLMIALMIRSLFWHKAEGRYRVDGRTKASWVVEVFGIARRSVTEARSRLLELGWLSELDSEQWQLNRYGTHDQINAGAFGPAKADETATPDTQNPRVFASPCLNNSSFPSGNINTRKPAPVRSGPADGSRERNAQKPPTLRNITDEDLRDIGRLLELHEQAVQAGVPVAGEAGRIDFLSLAERARASGKQPPRLFAWLLKHKRFDFIAQANEDDAASRLRVWHNGPREQQGGGGEPAARTPKPKPVELTGDDKVVIACIQTAQKRRGVEPFTLARQVKGWTRDRWDAAHAAYRKKASDRWTRE